MNNENDERLSLPSASGIERIVLCPASFKMEEAVVKSGAYVDARSEDAEEGTLLHAVIKGDAQESCLDEEQLSTIRRAESILHEAIGIATSELGAEKHTEVPSLGRLWAKDDNGELSFSGDIDWCCRIDGSHGDAALVVDWKFGRGDVTEASENFQLAAYAILLHELDPSFVYYYVAIIRPRACKENELTISRYSGDEIKKAKSMIIAACNEARFGAANQCPGVKQCKYCKAKSICASAHKEVTEIAKVNESEARISVVTGRLLEACVNAEKVIGAIRDRAKEMLEEDIGSIPGWTLKEGSSRSSITDATKAFQILSDKITTEDFCSAVTVSLSKLVKPWQSSAGLKSQKAAREDLEALLSSVIETKQTSKTLSRE